MKASDKRKAQQEESQARKKESEKAAAQADKERPVRVAAAYKEAKDKTYTAIQKAIGSSVQVHFPDMMSEVQSALSRSLIRGGYQVSINYSSHHDCGHDQGDRWYDNGIVLTTTFTIRW